MAKHSGRSGAGARCAGGARRRAAIAGRPASWRVLLAAGLLMLTGCGSREVGVEAQRLHLGNGAEPQDLDPHLVTGVPEHRILVALFEGLVTLDPNTLDVRPGMAASWEVSEDGLVYTFHLRRGAGWSNGDPVTAHDFVYSWKRNLSPALGSEYAYMLHCLSGGEAFNLGEIDDFAQVGVRALDDYTLEVELENPTPYFLSMQVHSSWLPVHKEAVEAHGAMTERGTPWTRAGNHVSNGPFMLDVWAPDRRVVCVKNPHYWDRDNVRLEGLVFYPIDNNQTEELLFRVGRLHMTASVPINKYEVYKKNNPQYLRNTPYLGTYYYRFNCKRAPFDDARVRRAFGLAIDRSDLVDNVVRMGRKPAYAFTPPGTAGYTAQAAMRFDPDEARRLLAEAGYPGGEGFPTCEILYNTSDDHKQIAEALQSMWKEHLGVSVTLANQEWKVYLSTLNQLDYDLARSAWIGDYVDPINFLECMTTGNGNNRTGWSNEEFDALIAKARASSDQEERFAAFQQAEGIMVREAPIAPIYNYTNVFLQRPEVKGVGSNLLGYLSFKDMYLEEVAE